MSTEKAILEKLKKILKVSNSIAMEQMRSILDMDKKEFDKKIVDWAEEFGFTIDREYVNVKKESVDDFIDMLDSQFKSWESKEKIGEGKIVTRAKIAPKIQLKPASEKESLTFKVILRGSFLYILSFALITRISNHVSK